MPLGAIGLKITGIVLEHRYRIIFGIHRKRDQFKILIAFPLSLQPFKPLAQHGALALTAGKDKIRDPNFSLEQAAGKNLSGLVLKRKVRSLVHGAEKFI